MFSNLLLDIITTRQRVHLVGASNPEKMSGAFLSICGRRWQLITLNVLIMRILGEDER